MSTGPKAYFISSLAPLYASLTPVTEALLRVVVGAFLVPHGAQKLFGAFGGYGLAGTGGFMESLGFVPGVFFAFLVGFVEFFGGIAIAVGFLTRPFALLATGVLAVATFLVHFPNGFFMSTGGFEYAGLWTVATLYFTARGGGPLSVDAKLGKEF